MAVRAERLRIPSTRPRNDPRPSSRPTATLRTATASAGAPPFTAAHPAGDPTEIAARTLNALHGRRVLESWRHDTMLAFALVASTALAACMLLAVLATGAIKGASGASAPVTPAVPQETLGSFVTGAAVRVVLLDSAGR